MLPLLVVMTTTMLPLLVVMTTTLQKVLETVKTTILVHAILPLLVQTRPLHLDYCSDGNLEKMVVRKEAKEHERHYRFYVPPVSI